MHLIELDRASFIYPSASSPAVNEVSLTIDAGEYLAIVGRNGSGKSSLLRLLDGLLAPSSGAARVRGLEASDPANRRAVSASVGLVFQSPADQIVSTSVEEDVAFGPENLGLPRPEIERRVDAALSAVGLERERRRPSHFLSPGQQQRLVVAGAACLAFDEATSMLDPEGRRAVLELIDGLVAAGTAVVHVTHDMNEAARARRLVALDGGRVAFDGSPARFFDPRGGAPEGLRRALGLPDAMAAAAAAGLEGAPLEGAASLAARVAASRAAGTGKAPAVGASAAGAPLPVGAAGAAGTAAGADGPAFELEGVAHAYLRGTMNETVALRELTLSVPRGAFVALVGRTGSGKSTVLQLLDALVAPFAGRVASLGVDLGARGADLRSIRTRAPLAVQRPEAALFESYAADDVAFGPRNLGLAGRALVERVRSAMEEAGLPYGAFRDRRTRSLSGGEKRELALAGILAMEGEALLLDEPTAALDPAARATVRSIIARERARGRTIVMATHSMEEAALADLVAVFREGRLAALGAPDRLFYDEYDPAWGLGRPFAAELSVELGKAGVELGSRPLDAEGLAAALSRLRAGAPR
jgi:energy-coupling factor transporter ATP-binding protein EcfA2